MNEAERQQALKDWIASRPECVRKLIEEFPFLSRYQIDGKTWLVCGWTESDTVILFDGNPYEGAEKKYVHAECLREHTPDSP